MKICFNSHIVIWMKIVKPLLETAGTQIMKPSCPINTWFTTWFWLNTCGTLVSHILWTIHGFSTKHQLKYILPDENLKWIIFYAIFQSSCYEIVWKYIAKLTKHRNESAPQMEWMIMIFAKWCTITLFWRCIWFILYESAHISIKIEMKRFFCNFKDRSQKCSNDKVTILNVGQKFKPTVYILYNTIWMCNWNFWNLIARKDSLIEKTQFLFLKWRATVKLGNFSPFVLCRLLNY